ncbi:hypothetical protein JB92DRAFT_180673 [Gautieria morchelliformis]|nr:hypothetical protein JB92DRAFT_180673 [Gautieria morchelliformis]
MCLFNQDLFMLDAYEQTRPAVWTFQTRAVPLKGYCNKTLSAFDTMPFLRRTATTNLST